MSEPPTDPIGDVHPSEPALLAVLDACEEYVRMHHDLLRADRRTSDAPAAMQPLCTSTSSAPPPAKPADICRPTKATRHD